MPNWRVLDNRDDNRRCHRGADGSAPSTDMCCEAEIQAHFDAHVASKLLALRDAWRLDECLFRASVTT
jgi:hypothetical protein